MHLLSVIEIIMQNTEEKAKPKFLSAFYMILESKDFFKSSAS